MCAGGSPCEGGEVLRGVQPHQGGGQGQQRAVHSTRRKCDEGIASSSTVLPLSPVSPVCTLCSLVHVILLMCCSCVHMRTHLWSCVLLCGLACSWVPIAFVLLKSCSPRRSWAAKSLVRHTTAHRAHHPLCCLPLYAHMPPLSFCVYDVLSYPILCCAVPQS